MRQNGIKKDKEKKREKNREYQGVHVKKSCYHTINMTE